jgi:hypothetical protein
VIILALLSGKVQPEFQMWSVLEKTSLYMRPVYMENRPINKIMYRPLYGSMTIKNPDVI